MIPNSIVAMRVFLNIAILRKGVGNERRRRLQPSARIAAGAQGRIIQARQYISIRNARGFAASVSSIETRPA
jgi:hypothetical protein